MSKRALEYFLFDIFIAIQKIKKVAKKFENSDELLHNFTDWDSIIREFEIIGETTKVLIQNNFLSQDYQIIVDFRNQITHKYFGIEPEIVWKIIHKDLPGFEQVVLQKIQTIEPSLKKELIESFVQDYNYLDFVIIALKSLY